MSSDAPVHIVDDDLAVRQSLAFLLATDGLAVQVHDSATAFLAAGTDRGGPVREHYLVTAADTPDPRARRTEVCWPVSAA